eukprot:TRINITY_DN3463_c0_g1_i1.p3 TRINITY_DN3463_c0_g1~~TRINITY_DN3463_c0_g1_i1.p3  ORF type:complete len:160 (+),score=37.10 TRINITY_DN3463_c0_g1_i1:977-1456(+)
MEDGLVVAVLDALEELLEEMPHRLGVEVPAVQVQELLEVLVRVLEHEGELLLVVDDVQKLHNVGVLQLLQQRDLPDGRAWNALLLAVQGDAFEGDQLPAGAVLRLEHHPVGPLSDLSIFWYFGTDIGGRGGDKAVGGVEKKICSTLSKRVSKRRGCWPP